MLQHRLVVECVLGRLLTSEEVVHHLDRNRSNNDSANLKLEASAHDHGLEHAAETRERFEASLTADQVAAALRGRTTLEAAAVLGVAHMTLRRRFPELLSMRTLPGQPHDEALLAAIRPLAADPAVGTRAACAQLGIAAATLRSACRRGGIEWVSAPAGRPSRRS